MKFCNTVTLECVDSTNEYIKSLPVYSCVRALAQTAGRGRLGRSFISPAGGLYFSVKIPNPCLRGLVTEAAAVAVASCIPGSGIKWPNDIILDGKKVCGILCASNSENMDIIIGVGINVACTPIEGSACTGGSTDELFNRVICALEHTLTLTEEGKREELLGLYRPLLLTVGIPVTVTSCGQSINGTAKGVDDDGALLVLCGGELYHISSGEATLSKPADGMHGR